MSLKSKLHTIKEKYKGTKMAPAFNALHTFLYLPNETTHNGTHIKAADDLKRTMNTVIMAMVPCLIFGMFNAGYQHHLALGTIESAQGFLGASFWTLDNLVIGMWKVLPLVVVSYGVGLAIEFLFAVIKGHEVEEGYLVTGMLVPLIVPIDLPLWMLAVAVAFGVVIGKEVFGGTGMNILNPALTIRAFLFFAYPTWMSGDKVWVHGFLHLLGYDHIKNKDYYKMKKVEKKILEMLSEKEKFRIAEPGEFTKRAFLNGILDLTQAEAIADLINSSSEQAARCALHSLQGYFSKLINNVVDKTIHLRMYVEAAIDFPEEEIDFLQDQHIHTQLHDIHRHSVRLDRRPRRLGDCSELVSCDSPQSKQVLSGHARVNLRLGYRVCIHRSL